MKLNKQQLVSLADKIYSEVKEQKDAARKLAVETWKQENQQLINEELLKYGSIFVAFDNNLIKNVTLTLDGYKYLTSKEQVVDFIIQDLVHKNVDTKEFMFSISEKSKIHQELVLATIEADNLEDLINSVKSKF